MGLLGGTFDPPHFGHLAVAEAVLRELGLDEVVFVVANDPWQKTGEGHVSPAHVRVEMTRALVAGHPKLSVDDREVRRGGPTYTVDTLVELTTENPSVAYFLITGEDTASRIHTWHRHEDVMSLSTLVVVNRAPSSAVGVPQVASGRVEHVVMAPVDISSTRIRESVARGVSIDSMTAPGVCRIIADHGLYEVAR